MGYKKFPNPDNNEWLNKYNALVCDVREGRRLFINVKLSLHHIIPRSVAPSLAKDKDNYLYVPFKEHMDLHYYLWKADKKYAAQLWFGCVYGRKHGLWDLPDPDTEYEQLKKDVAECHLEKRKGKAS